MSIAGWPFKLPDRKSSFNQQQILLLGTFALGLCIVVAYLVVSELWMFAAAMVAALPIFVLLHRYPLTGLFVWLLLAQFLVATSGGNVRKVYWLIHRALPPIAIESRSTI